MPASEQVDVWVAVWIFCSRWAGTVRRGAAGSWSLARAGAEPLIDEVRARILDAADEWRWPAIEEFGDLDDDELEVTYALRSAFEEVTHRQFGSPGTEEEQELELAWKLALSLELSSRGQLPRVVTELGDYDGEERLVLAPSQLYYDEVGRVIPASRRKRIVDEWCEFLAAGSTPIRYLYIASRAPKRLISALHGQTQLRGLEIKWGDYDDLSAVAGMPDLWRLVCRGASALGDLTPLPEAGALRVVELEDCRRLSDPSPLAGLTSVESLSITIRSLPTIAFLRGMTSLRSLALVARVLDEDYTPLLDHRQLDELWIRKQRRMQPSLEELARHIPVLRYG